MHPKNYQVTRVDFDFVRIYERKFSTHFPSGKRGCSRKELGFVLDALKGSSSKLAEKTKRELPSHERVETTFRNINWLLRYWMCETPCHHSGSWDYSACYPDPISPEFGFVMDGKKKVVRWMDSATEAGA